jgi:glycine oxidase
MPLSDRPFWLDTVSEEDFLLAGGRTAGLPDSTRVAIVGGGIVGLACAHYLAAAGVDGVLLLERGRLLHEASAANGGGLWPGEQAPGPGVFYDVGRASLELIRGFAAEADADVELRGNGVLDLACSEAEAAALRARTVDRRAAGIAVEWLGRAEVLDLEPELSPDGVFGAAFYRDDCHVNPAKLGAAFARAAQQHGASIVTGAEVRAIECGSAGARLVTERGSVEAAHVVITGGPWSGQLLRHFGVEVPIRPAKGQLVATAPLPPLLHRSVMGRYGVIQTAGGNVLSGGNVEFAEFDREPRPETRDAIVKTAGELLPALRDVPVTHSWARFRPHTPDELPLLGWIDPERRHLVAAGHHKNGLLLSAVTGRIVADLIVHGETTLPLRGLEPDRFRP